MASKTLTVNIPSSRHHAVLWKTPVALQRQPSAALAREGHSSDHVTESMSGQKGRWSLEC